MKIQEMRNAKQAYEQPWTESVQLQVEKIICGSPDPHVGEYDDPD